MGMSYRIPQNIKDPIYFAEYQTWFKKSMADVVRIISKNDLDPYKFYQAQYNVKLHCNSFQVIEQVEFPSEKEATLFMLRWS